MGCVSDGQEAKYREVIKLYVALHIEDYATLNVNNTQEIIVDFRNTRNTPNKGGEVVEDDRPGCSTGQQTEMELQTWGCLQEGIEQTELQSLQTKVNGKKNFLFAWLELLYDNMP